MSGSGRPVKGIAVNKAKDNTLPLRLGIDTGGTYTDAALIDSDNKVVNVAKALTTHEDLSAGIGAAIDAVLAKGDCATSDIATVALSTTLATNSIVERKWDRVALVAVGFEPRDLDRERLREALSGDPVVMIRGGHDHHGTEIEFPDLDGLVGQVKGLGPTVSALAVVSRFATRNPEHEVRIRDRLREATGEAGDVFPRAEFAPERTETGSYGGPERATRGNHRQACRCGRVTAGTSGNQGSAHDCSG